MAAPRWPPRAHSGLRAVAQAGPSLPSPELLSAARATRRPLCWPSAAGDPAPPATQGRAARPALAGHRSFLGVLGLFQFGPRDSVHGPLSRGGSAGSKPENSHVQVSRRRGSLSAREQSRTPGGHGRRAETAVTAAPPNDCGRVAPWPPHLACSPGVCRARGPGTHAACSREAPACAHSPLTPTAGGSRPAACGPQPPARSHAATSTLPGRPRREPGRKRFVSCNAAALWVPCDTCGSSGPTQTNVLVYGSRLSAALWGRRV